ncbi:MAG: hypothetical protein JO307_22460 [Bryobacterales bacterium]|nr:hypothetical protein [Bryobacterales bacterium]MBV9400133.1 hypothetical protein [Bryobacterales bacterium]
MTTSTVNTTNASAGSSSPTAASAATAGALGNTDVFMKLLVAQLKYQDPLSPADGTQFVTQLAQFSTLEQTTQGTSDLDTIRQVLTAQAASASSSPAPQSAANGPAGNQAEASTTQPPTSNS